ncbi:hypothetical protein V6N12_028895 [Hibiscus sabdariffa]|uniref:Uncharacterized protein n=1 Tax=Hibiscus sabdariffa TaxID=183260 RepID=A0ABR2F760_9ROSI
MSFQDFCSQVFSGELRRAQDENFVETKDSRTTYHQEIKLLISPVKFPCDGFSPVNRKASLRIRRLTIASRRSLDLEGS